MNYGCIGEKLSHSFSADIHRRLFDYAYELREIPREELDGFMTRRDFKAINVTIPYKEAVIPYLDHIDEVAAGIGAVNTIVNRNGVLYGYNTDFSGLCALICRNGMDLTDKKVLILGSGGTSKTALAVAQHLGCREVLRVSRTARDGCITYDEAKRYHSDAQVLLNTTPCGMYPNIGNSAVDLADYTMVQAVVDAVYNPLRSRLVCDARERGIPAVGGLYMLVAQAAFAAERFVGETVPAEKIDAIYRALVNDKQNIVLVGMPGCGKTTVGTRLAQAMNTDFIDTDTEIVQREGSAIPAIFAAVGEPGFRNVESLVIRQVAARQHAVIATGGGAVLRQENIRLLRENGRIYFLDRSLESLVTTDDRPLSSNRADLERRYRERYDIYCECCDCHLDANDSIEEIVNRIREDFLHETSGD